MPADFVECMGPRLKPGKLLRFTIEEPGIQVFANPPLPEFFRRLTFYHEAVILSQDPAAGLHRCAGVGGVRDERSVCRKTSDLAYQMPAVRGESLLLASCSATAVVFCRADRGRDAIGRRAEVRRRRKSETRPRGYVEQDRLPVPCKEAAADHLPVAGRLRNRLNNLWNRAMRRIESSIGWRLKQSGNA
jgi:hypothetical protein